MTANHDVATRLDHIVVGAPDLARAMAIFAARTGVAPAPGGRHPGRGTANALYDLGGGAFLELIGRDVEAPDPAGPRWLGLDDLGRHGGPAALTWAVRTTDIGALVERARASGWDPGDPVAQARRRPDGTSLTWRLTPDTATSWGGAVPFVIDWGTTPTPVAAGGLPALELMAFEVGVPDVDGVEQRCAALGFEAEASGHPVRIFSSERQVLAIEVRGPAGTFRLPA